MKEIIYYCEQGDPHCASPHCRCNTVRGKKPTTQMTDIEKKHLEAIKEQAEKYYILQNIYTEAAKSCARITQLHGEIQRLEGYIFGLKDAINEGVLHGQIGELEQQLKDLKG